MSLFLTANFNVEIYRISENGCPRSTIPYIGLTFENIRPSGRDGFIAGNGDFAPDDVVINVFKEGIESPFNYKTLAQIGTYTGEKNTRVKLLPFEPSVENLSIYFYRILKPIFTDYKVKLVSVHVRDEMYTTSYPKLMELE